MFLPDVTIKCVKIWERVSPGLEVNTAFTVEAMSELERVIDVLLEKSHPHLCTFYFFNMKMTIISYVRGAVYRQLSLECAEHIQWATSYKPYVP